ncbi:MAG: PKD domain-containing protein [Bacteroidales bacterium]|nr:PKD domain-containing protein [Bacteroidales bacterium]MBN2817954.1 PKD domain-containing protein [Bacteroidales bacterium]
MSPLQTCILYNNWGTSERVNSAPQNLSFEQNGLDIFLNWDKINNQYGYSYNIRLGTTIDCDEIIQPESDLSTGYRYIPQPGNASYGHSWKVSGLEPGKYYWSVQAIDQSFSGGPWSFIDTFYVSTLDADFTFDTTCAGQPTTFEDKSTVLGEDIIVNYFWDFGDGSNSTLKDPTHTYDTGGTYTVKLTVVSEFTEQTDSAEVFVKYKPQAEYSSEPVCLNTVSDFTDNTNTSNITVSSYLWNFGNSKTSDEIGNTSHIYTDTGTYNVTLIVTATNSCFDSYASNVYIAPNPPSAIIPVGNIIKCLGDSVILYPAETNANYTYRWNLDGVQIPGATSDSLTVSNISGNYSLYVQNSTNISGLLCSTTSSNKQITFNPVPDVPMINAVKDTFYFCPGDSILLDVTNNPALHFDWLIDNQSTGTSSHEKFAKERGVYIAKVTDTVYHCSSLSSDTVVIIHYPEPTGYLIENESSLNICNGNSSKLRVPYNPQFSYQWLKDGDIVPAETADSIDASQAGTYTVRIINEHDCNAISVNSKILIVRPSPATPVLESIGNTTFCQNDSLIIRMIGTTSYKDYIWSVSGYEDSEKEIVVKSAGNYRLTVINTQDCASAQSEAVSVTVNQNPATPAIRNQSSTNICDGNTVRLSLNSSPTGLSFQWHDILGAIPDQTLADIDVYEAGEYLLEVINSSGCSAYSSPIVVTVAEYPTVPVIENQTPNGCPFDQVILEVTNFNPNYDYYWNRSNEKWFDSTSKTLIGILEEERYFVTSVNPENRGCFEESDEIDLTFESDIEKPKLTIFGPTICYVGCSNNNVSTYRWYIDNEIVKDETDKILMIGSIENLENDTIFISLEISDDSGCTAIADTFITEKTKFKLAGYTPPDLSIILFPNPSQGIFNIDFEGSYYGYISLEILDITGRKIISEKIEKSAYRIGTEQNPNLKTGIYTLRIIAENKVWTEHLIIE